MLKSIASKINGLNIDSHEEVYGKVAEKYFLTTRELQMLRGIARGKTNGEIAVELFITEATVKFHVHNLLKKLSISSRYEVALWIADLTIEKSDVKKYPS